MSERNIGWFFKSSRILVSPMASWNSRAAYSHNPSERSAASFSSINTVCGNHWCAISCGRTASTELNSSSESNVCFLIITPPGIAAARTLFPASSFSISSIANDLKRYVPIFLIRCKKRSPKESRSSRFIVSESDVSFVKKWNGYSIFCNCSRNRNFPATNHPSV